MVMSELAKTLWNCYNSHRA